MESNQPHWTAVISNERRFNWQSIREIWQYRDLISTFIFRDLISVYKQTILGPLWFLLQPVMTTITFTVIFSQIARISTNGIPPLVFYMSGVIFWNYFSETLLKTSNTFITNSNLFSKVYFPRLIIPISVIFSNLIKFSIQLVVFLVMWIYYLVFTDANFSPHYWALALLPFIVLYIGVLGFSIGLTISSWTIKFRDLAHFIAFGLQLVMYGTPVIYSLSLVPERYRWILELNPLTGALEFARFALLGSEAPPLRLVFYALGFMLVMLAFSIGLFSRVEKTSMDTV